MVVSRTAPENLVLERFADDIAKRITRKTIASLQSIKTTLSGGDSMLANAWDDICVQRQSELSMFWDLYDETASLHVESYVKELKSHEKTALWFQTDQGSDWLLDLDADPDLDLDVDPDLELDLGLDLGLDVNPDVDPDDTPPVIDDEIVDWLVREYIYKTAGGWSNERIRAYLDLW